MVSSSPSLQSIPLPSSPHPHAGKDLTWWNRGKLNAHDELAATAVNEEEIRRIKEEEEQMLLEAL